VLIDEKKLSMKVAAARLKMPLTTVRRLCRTLQIGRFSPDIDKSKLSTASQIPYGWSIEPNGVLVENAEEMKWISVMGEMRQDGKSLRDRAKFLKSNGVKTKNRGQWHAKTISLILKRNIDKYTK
jgi:hypothetical protein